jgi:hypothetical protein
MTRAVPWRGPDGELIAWFGITTSIHHHKQLMEQLREADRRKDQFLATLVARAAQSAGADPERAQRAPARARRRSRQQLLGIVERQMQLMVR